MNLTAFENRLVGKAIFSLVVAHIEFAHIRPLNIILIWISILKVDFTARSNLTAVENDVVEKAMSGSVVNYIWFVHVRLIKMILIHF